MKKFKTIYYDYKGKKHTVERDTMESVYGYILWDDFASNFKTQAKLNQFNDKFNYTKAPNWWFMRKEVMEAGTLGKLWNWVTGKENVTYVKTRYVGIEELEDLTPDQVTFADNNNIVMVGSGEQFNAWLHEYDEIWQGEEDDIQ